MTTRWCVLAGKVSVVGHGRSKSREQALEAVLRAIIKSAPTVGNSPAGVGDLAGVQRPPSRTRANSRVRRHPGRWNVALLRGHAIAPQPADEHGVAVRAEVVCKAARVAHCGDVATSELVSAQILRAVSSLLLTGGTDGPRC